VRDGCEFFETRVDEHSVACLDERGSVSFIIVDDSLTVPEWSRYVTSPLDCLMPLLHMCMGGPMRQVPRGWQTTGSIFFRNQFITGDTLTITFNHPLSELGIPAWMPADTHSLTRHLIGVADNLAEVDPALSGDPRVFAKRAFEVFGDEVEVIFANAIDKRRPLNFISTSRFNTLFRPDALATYNSDKINRPYLYSK